jgi:hypothetical protein
MRVFLRVAIAAVGIALVASIAAYSYHKFGKIPPPPKVGTSEGATCAPWRFHKTLSKEEQQHVLDGEFKVVTSTELMPPRIKQAFTEVACLPQFALANPGEKYQVTDVIDEPGLPFRRLVFAGVSGNKWLIHYEHGGIGYSTAVVLLELDAQNKVRFVWGGAGAECAKNLSALRTAIGAGRFSDCGTFYW